MTHERGHTFGLDHVGTQSSDTHSELTMYPSVKPCNDSHRTLGLGDMLGLLHSAQLAPATGSFVRMRLYDLGAERVGGEVTLALDRSGVGESRMAVHGLSDEIVRRVTGKAAKQSFKLAS